MITHNLIIVHKLSDGKIMASLYAHMIKNSPCGEKIVVHEGDVIGLIGMTGASSEHLHIVTTKGVDKNSKGMDPNRKEEFENYSFLKIKDTGEIGWYWEVQNYSKINIYENYEEPSLFIKNFTTQDTTSPTVDAFDVTPRTITLGQSFTISYTVSDTGGSDLKQVELWRTTDTNGDGEPDWPTGQQDYIAIQPFAGETFYTGSFLDAPSSSGTYWYGIHVVDNAGNIGIEPNPPGSIMVTVTSCTTTYYRDSDGDGYGDPNISLQSCTQAVGYVMNNLDCDDGDATVNPTTIEGPFGNPTCDDGKDNDCDTFTDSADSSCKPSSAGAINLPRTGQTKCYDTAGTEIACTCTGQDGDIQAGVEWPTTGNTPSGRFNDNGDGTITDLLTGIMWLKDVSCFGTMNWQNALDTVTDFNNNPTKYNCQDLIIQYPDWHLPNINELESFFNADVPIIAVWLNAQGFTNVHSNYYWSSTTGAYGTYFDTYGAWSVDLWSGYVYVRPKDEYGYEYVWPVRSSGQPSTIQLPQTGQKISYIAGDDGDIQRGVAWPVPRFTDKSDGTVTDNLTGLMWLKDANCIAIYPSFDNDYLAGDGRITWQHALDFIKGINNGTYSNCGAGYNDWRLSNRKELLSLIDYSNVKPALPTDHLFTNVQSDSYWSSTTYAHGTYNAWIVSPNGGGFGADKGFLNWYYEYVWPVRGGNVLSPPTGVTASKAGIFNIRLSWNSVSDATSYNTYWSRSPGVTKTSGTKISGITGNSYTTGALATGTYYYVITAVNCDRESVVSDEVSVTLSGGIGEI